MFEEQTIRDSTILFIVTVTNSVASSRFSILAKVKVNIDKSHGDVSLVEQDIIDYLCYCSPKI